MALVPLLLIALSLAMDAFAVSLAYGCSLKSLRLRHPLIIAGTFGLFQAAMPVAGWYAGRVLAPVIRPVDHWIVLGLLLLVGIHMIKEGCAAKTKPAYQILAPAVLFALGIATSLDALALGLTFALLDVAILWPVLIIGGVTFLLSWIAVYMGRAFGLIFGPKIDIIGGVILIGLGIKICFEHVGGGY